MPFTDQISNEASDPASNLNKKPGYPIIPELRNYLKNFYRTQSLPIAYTDLLRYDNSFPLMDANGKDSLWLTVSFPHNDQEELYSGLIQVYVLLASDGNMDQLKHLRVDRVDYCLFGNSNPFRVKIKNMVNDNYDYYYIKKADASRIYGLELEHIVSPNKINFFVDENTLIEEHIMGIPGDQFLENRLLNVEHNKVRLAKEFVKFNERSFLRLLGDMRSYNFVIDMTPDFDQIQYRIRCIDFDQQSYEGRMRFYLPQFFRDNVHYVKMALDVLSNESIEQYQAEERALSAKRITLSQHQYIELIKVMRKDKISSDEKVKQLAKELAEYHNDTSFLTLSTMGDLVEKNIHQCLHLHF